jgi:hypothetical protein
MGVGGFQYNYSGCRNESVRGNDFCFTRKARIRTKPIESAALAGNWIGRNRGSGFLLIAASSLTSPHAAIQVAD